MALESGFKVLPFKNVTRFTLVQMQRMKQKFANSLSEEQHKIQRLQRELEKERLNSLRIQQKLEQDFDFHKQMVVNDCGRHIEGIRFERFMVLSVQV